MVSLILKSRMKYILQDINIYIYDASQTPNLNFGINVMVSQVYIDLHH
jgi:hypothetical protein